MGGAAGEEYNSPAVSQPCQGAVWAVHEAPYEMGTDVWAANRVSARARPAQEAQAR